MRHFKVIRIFLYWSQKSDTALKLVILLKFHKSFKSCCSLKRCCTKCHSALLLATQSYCFVGRWQFKYRRGKEAFRDFYSNFTSVHQPSKGSADLSCWIRYRPVGAPPASRVGKLCAGNMTFFRWVCQASSKIKRNIKLFT